MFLTTQLEALLQMFHEMSVCFTLAGKIAENAS